MHLQVRLPKVEPAQVEPPTHCPLPHPRNRKRRCPGTTFKAHQHHCRKLIRDTRHVQVIARRYRCLTCRRTFRVYPTGVSSAQHSDTLKGLSVLLYVLGLSYQGVSDLLDSLEFFLSKTTVYHNVQAAGQQAIQLRQHWLAGQAGKIQVLGIDCTHVKRLGQDRIVAVATAILTGQALTFDLLDGEGAVPLEHWVRELAQAVGAEVLVTDDADGLKTVAEQLGLQHQICRAHVNRNTHDLIAALGTQALDHPDPVPVGLPQLTVDQFLEDLDTVEWIIKSVPADGRVQLEHLWERYRLAPPPTYGHRASMWYRLRRLTLDWAENWSRLSLFQGWRSPTHQKLDGTNNVTEQVIGQSVKERYRTMRGYKRDQSILNVSSLLDWIRMQGDGYNVAPLFAN